MHANHWEACVIKKIHLCPKQTMSDAKPIERVLLPNTVTPSHYDVHLTPDFEVVNNESFCVPSTFKIVASFLMLLIYR